MTADQYVAFVLCRKNCGRVGLTQEQYEYQLTHPQEGWTCPGCLADAELELETVPVE